MTEIFKKMSYPKSSKLKLFLKGNAKKYTLNVHVFDSEPAASLSSFPHFLLCISLCFPCSLPSDAKWPCRWKRLQSGAAAFESATKVTLASSGVECWYHAALSSIINCKTWQGGVNNIATHTLLEGVGSFFLSHDFYCRLLVVFCRTTSGWEFHLFVEYICVCMRVCACLCMCDTFLLHIISTLTLPFMWNAK